MMKHYRIKYWLYKQDQWIIGILVILLILFSIIALIDVSQNDEFIKAIEFRVWVASIVGLITLLFAFMRQKHNDMSVFFSLFEKFNNRYEELNDYLNTIHRSTTENEVVRDKRLKPMSRAIRNIAGVPKELSNELSSEESIKNILDQYLNLCAEEYLAFSNGYIPPEIMQYWTNGMKIFFKNHHMKSYFEEELKTDSYYQFKNFAIEQFDLNISNET